MSTAAEQEAERRYPESPNMRDSAVRQVVSLRYGFVQGAAFERERFRELLEAAEAYLDARTKARPGDDDAWYVVAVEANRLLAAAAALNEEGGK